MPDDRQIVVTGLLRTTSLSKGWRVVRALAFHSCNSGSMAALCHRWVDFVVGLRFAPRVSLRALQHFQFAIQSGYRTSRKSARTDVASSLTTNIFSYGGITKSTEKRIAS